MLSTFNQNKMTQEIITYIIVALLWIFTIASFVIGIEKMIKIILWNYILGTICLAASQSINLWVNYMNSDPEGKTIGILNSKLAVFIWDARIIIILILYAALLVLIFHKSKIYISLPMDDLTQKSLYLVFVPLTVLSIILTLQIAIIWPQAMNIQDLEKIASWLAENKYLYGFLTMTPVRMLLHGIATIIITSELKINLKTDVDIPEDINDIL